MRHALSRRPVALLAATALLSTGGVAAGLTTGTAFADEQLSVSPTFSPNNAAGNTTLTFNSTSADFAANPTITFRLHADPALSFTSVTPPQVAVPNTKRLTADFDLRQQAPGLYDVMVAGAAPASAVHSCTSCFTVTGFQPAVTSINRGFNNPNVPAGFEVNGRNFARGAVVTFVQGGVVDSAVTFTTSAPGVDGDAGGYTDNPTAKNPAANRIVGSVAVRRTGANPALGGAYDVVVRNTDSKVATCAGCFIIPRIDTVYRADKTPAASPTSLAYAVTTDLLVGGRGFIAKTATAPGTIAQFHPAGSYTGTSNVTINSTTVLSPELIRLNVTIADPSGPSTALRDLTLSNVEGGYQTYVGALTLNPRPGFPGSNGAPNFRNPGVSATNTVITLTGSNFQTGATATLAPSTGITVNSLIVDSPTSARLSLTLAPTAPLVASTIKVTNLDLGTNTGTATITPTRAPIVSTLSPTSRSVSQVSPTSFSMTLSGDFSRSTLNGSTCSAASCAAYTAPKIVFLDDPTITAGGVTFNNNGNPAYTGATATVTLPANAAPGARRVGFLDENFSLVECFTPSGGPCFNIDSLGVTGITPNLDTNDKTVNVTITGGTFALGALPKLVRSGFEDLLPVAGSVTVVNGSTITATFDLNNAPPSTGGGWSVRVTNSSGDTGICVGCFTIAGAAPAFADVVPGTVPAGKTSSIVRVTGTDFARGATLTFSPCGANGACNPRVVSSRLLDRNTYEFTLDTTASTAGVRNLAVRNADGQTTPATDCVGCFTISPAATASSITPASRAPQSPTVSVTVTGTNFNGTPSVVFGGTGVTAGPASTVTATSFSVPVTVAELAALGSRSVTVTNGDGATVVCSCTFEVVAPPKVTAISPANVARGTNGVSITVTGTHFTTGGVSLDLGPGVTVTAATATSETSISATINVAAAALPRGLRDVKVTSTDAASGGSGTLLKGFGVGDIPLAPVLSSATRGDTRVDLVWAAPTDDGGLPLSYSVTVTPAVGTVTVNGTAAAVTGLVNGTTYAFTVKATNALGASPASNSRSAKPATTPDAPSAVTATRGDATATVSWTAPVNSGGEPVTSYTVSASPGMATVTTANGSTTSAQVTGLTNGTAYTFSVVATNAVGNSGPSAASDPVTPLAVQPEAPTNLVADASPAAGSVSLAWTAPPANTQTPITQYAVVVSSGAGSVTYPADRTQTTAVVSGLTNGTTYSFQVRARTTQDGPLSTSVSATPYTVPAAVTGLAGTPGDGQVGLAWTAPANGGRPVTGYTVTVSPSAGTTTVSGTSATVTGLTNGTAYTFTVAATNLRGNGPTASVTRTPAAVPGAPTAVTATAGPARAGVSWTAPASNGGSPVTGYTVTASPGGATATSTTTSATVAGLTPGTSYTFTVVATNATGASPASSPSNAVTPTAPQSSVTLGAPGRIVFGATVPLRGRVTRSDSSVGFGTVTLRARDDAGVTRTLGSTTTTSAGDYAFSVRPGVNTTYTVVYAGDAKNAGSTSAARRVLVSTRITASAPRGAASTPQVITGGVSPNKAGRTLELSRVLADGRVVLLARTAVASNGTYRFSVRLAKGSYTLQVVIGTTTGNAAGSIRFGAVRT